MTPLINLDPHASARTSRMTYELPPGKTKLGLDIGCGNTMLTHTAKMFPNVHWLGLDACDFSECYPEGQFIQRDLRYSLPFPFNTFDIIWSHHCVEHLPSLHPDHDNPMYPGAQDYLIWVINQMWLHLKVGGEAHIVVPWNKHPNAWRHPTHYRHFDESYWGYFSFSYPPGDHAATELWSKWQLTRNDVVDNTHVYAILKKLEWKDELEMQQWIGELRPDQRGWLL